MLITNGTVITLGKHPRVIPGGAIYVDADTIAEVGSTAGSMMPAMPHMG